MVRQQWTIGLLLLLSGAAEGEWITQNSPIMGTQVHVEAWHDDAAVARRAVADVLAEMRHLDNMLSPYTETSEVARVNREAAKAPTPVSEQTLFIIDKSLEFSRASAGAFDITFAAIGHHYDFRNHKRPSSAEIQELLPLVDFRKLAVNDTQRTIAFEQVGMKIDLGGIAKGYAVDQAAAILRRHGIVHALVSAGGDMRIIGDKLGRPWMVGIKHPRHPETNIAVIPLSDVAVSTSGDYERFFIEDGVRYHHILDTHTGVSATRSQSVTIIGDQGIITDALSTTLFVLGAEEGFKLLAKYPNIDAIVIDASGTLHYSPGLENPASAKTTN